MRFLIRFCFLLSIFFIIFILSVFIWTYLPKEDVSLSEFYLDGDFLFLKLSLDKKDFFLLDEIIDFKFGDKYSIESFSKRLLLKRGCRFFAPLTLILLVDKDQDNDEFKYTLLVKSKKLSRFLEILLSLYIKTPFIKRDYKFSREHCWSLWSRQEDDGGIEAIAEYGDIYLFSSSRDKVKGLIHRFNSITRDKKDNFQTFFAKRWDEPFLIYINDNKKTLNFYLEKAKEKTSYNFFPTFSNLDEVFIYFGKDSSCNLKRGQIDFAFKENADFKKARKDAWFISQILKRIFEANFYQFIYDIKIVKTHIIVDFNLGKKRRSSDD